MDQLAIARALHVLAVVLWIGGVGFVTTVLLPAVRRLKTPAERVAFFDAIERRFAWQARATTLLAGLTGFYMTTRLDLWSRFQSAAYWWMHAMVAVWLLFTMMLFVAEPLILHRWFQKRAMSDPEGTFAHRAHASHSARGEPDHDSWRRGWKSWVVAVLNRPRRRSTEICGFDYCSDGVDFLQRGLAR